MVTIKNTKVYDLAESIVASGYAMGLNLDDFDNRKKIIHGIPIGDESIAKAELTRAKRLAKAGGGSGHSNFRKGIRVSFDIIYPNYFSPELQRYSFLDIVTSSSKMHRLVSMDMDSCFNKYVTKESKEQMKRLINEYNEAKGDERYKAFMRVVSNCPQGIELFMRCSTNYEQLATIYRQRKDHKLKEDWGAFCKWIESLPLAKELITINAQ